MSTKNNHLFSIEDLGKSFGKNLIFNNVNFKFYPNDRIALVGRNGRGKTTLMNMVCGLSEITKGKIKFSNKKSFFANLGIHFQTGSYPNGIRTNDLMMFYGRIYKKNFYKSSYFKKFEIDKLINKRMSGLSFGQKKRFELFLLMAAENKILILDEITAGVDVWTRFQLVKTLTEHLKKHKTSLIYISHNYDEIKAICNRILILSEKGILKNVKINANSSVKEIIEKQILKL